MVDGFEEGAEEKVEGALGCPPLATLGSSFLSPSQASCAKSTPRPRELPEANLPCPPRLGKQNLATSFGGAWPWVVSQFIPSSEGKLILLKNSFFEKKINKRQSSGER